MRALLLIPALNHPFPPHPGSESGFIVCLGPLQGKSSRPPPLQSAAEPRTTSYMQPALPGLGKSQATGLGGSDEPGRAAKG